MLILKNMLIRTEDLDQNGKFLIQREGFDSKTTLSKEKEEEEEEEEEGEEEEEEEEGKIMIGRKH